jgi:catechol 2,3-dioxygenase-like lactoylglutathione lyase family enzyme
MAPSVNHVGITVTDLDASIEFYVGVVGFELMHRTPPVSRSWFDTLTWNEGAVVESAMLSCGPVVLQLVRYRNGGGGIGPMGHNVIGSVHLCMATDDVEEKHASVTETGLHRPTPIVDIDDYGLRSFYVEDPDGVPVEFVQRVTPSTPPPQH